MLAFSLTGQACHYQTAGYVNNCKELYPFGMQGGLYLKGANSMVSHDSTNLLIVAVADCGFLVLIPYTRKHRVLFLKSPSGKSYSTFRKVEKHGEIPLRASCSPITLVMAIALFLFFFKRWSTTYHHDLIENTFSPSQ